MMDDIGFDGGKYTVEDMPKIRPVLIEDILKQHRERIVLETSVGTIVFKHITRRMKERIDVIRRIRYPQAFELEQEFRVVAPMAQAEGADENAVARAVQLAVELQHTMDCYLLGCIEHPFLTTMDDLDALLESLKDDEREAVRQIHTLLTAWNQPVDYSMLEVSERFHIPIIDRAVIEEPTYQQFLALHSIIEQEHKATEDLYKSLEVRT